MSLVKGSYRGRGVSGGLGNTSTGQPQVAVELQVTEEGEFHGETITWFGYFTEGTEDRTLDSLRILGWKTDDLSNLDGICDNEVRFVVDEEEYQGKVRTKVKWINRIGGLALKSPMSPQDAKAFAAQMKGKAIASRQAGGAQQATPGTRPAQQSRPASPPRAGGAGTTRQRPPDDLDQGGGNDDIPF